MKLSLELKKKTEAGLVCKGIAVGTVRIRFLSYLIKDNMIISTVMIIKKIISKV
jgi:hypothetical protein